MDNLKSLKFRKMRYYSKKHFYLWLLLVFVTLPGLAQQKVFTGTINDQTGKPVVNAMITIREQPGIKVFTDNDGKFSVTAETGQMLDILTTDNRYKSIRTSFDQITIVVSDKDDLIPVGNRKQVRRDELTSAIGVVKASELVKSSVLNPADALYGKIPGLTILQNGGPSWNNNPDIFIRGVETFGINNFVNTSILTIVDGFERPISSLSLAEIESVAVLKDAVALAPYGLRGANGVLLVTTKRGSGKGLSINVNYEHAVTQAFRLPEFLDGPGYTNAVNQARANDGLAPLYSEPELQRYESGSSPYLYPNVNWMEESLRNYGNTDRFNISFQEQANAVRYYAMVNYDHEVGILGPTNLNNGYSTESGSRKFNFRTNVEMDLTKSTKLSVKFAGNLGESNRPSTTNNDESDIFSAIYNTPASAYPIKTYMHKWGGTSTYNNNPIALISAQGYSITGKRELMSDIILEQKLDRIITGLSAEGGVSFDKSFNYLDKRSMQFQYEQLSPILDPVTFDVADTASTLFGTNTSMGFNTSVPIQSRRSTIFGNLNYSKSWGENELTSMLLFQSEDLTRSGRYNVYRHLLTAGTVHYGKSGKYFVDLAMSYSGTNILPAGSRFGFFPALSVAWKISNEEFLKASPVVNDLKLRASWGLAGNDQVIQNININPWVGANGYFFNNTNTSFGGYREGRLASTPLTFETSAKSNIGIDASLFNILDVNFDVFYNKRKGILVETGGYISGVLGVDQPYSSVGVTTNKGFELGMNLHRSVGNLNYHFGGQLSYAKSKIIDMLEVYRPEFYLKRTGQSIGQAFGLEATGLFADYDEIAASPKQTFSIVRPGDIRYKDQNEDGKINSYDEVPIGHSTKTPEFYFSGNIGVEFKNIGIEATLQGTANQTVYLNTQSIFIPLRSNTNISTFSNDAWTPATAATATLPCLSTLDNANNYRPNSIWYTEGSYLKLRSVEVYYSFPKQILSKLKLESAKLYLRGMNLLSFDNIKIVDPEEIGITYPTVSSYNVGIQLGF